MIDSNGKVVLRQVVDEIKVENAIVNKRAMVPAGTYKLEIDDGYGDGICKYHVHDVE